MPSKDVWLSCGLVETAGIRSTKIHYLLTIGILFSVIIAGCGKDKKPTSPGGSDWKLGQATTYTVDSPGRATIADSVTGQQFLFPEGGHGTLQIAPIISGPAAPYAGSGFSVSFDHDVPVAVVVDPGGSDIVMVMGYGTAPGAYDDIPGPGTRWVAMPIVDSLESGLAFQLTLPFTPTAGSSQSAGAPADSINGFSQYWISSIPAGSDEATHMIGLELQSQTFVDGVLDRLSPTRQTAARAEVQGRLRAYYAYDGFFYTGFWWRSLGSMGRIIHPTIHLRLNANAGNVAHETGHYITHVLVGDDVWSTLEGQAPLWDTGHGIRDDVGRNMLLEDYAYFSEWLTVGTVKSYDLQDPHVIFGGMSPLTSDYPGIEGFAAVLLASLKRTTPTVRSLIGGQSTDVPVIGLSDAQVYDIIAGGATGIEALRERIATAAGSQADKLPAIFQRSGWRYSVKGRLITPEGQPLPGATVSSVSLVGDRVYRGGSSSVPSGSDGRFTIVGEVFPGTSNIRVWNGQDSIDVPITIAWSKPTNVTVDLGDLRVARRVDLAPLRRCGISVVVTNAYFDNPFGGYKTSGGTNAMVAGSFSGNQFTGSLDMIDFLTHRVAQLTATVDPQSGEVLTLVLTESSSGDGWSATTSLSVNNINMVRYDSVDSLIQMECSISGEDACSHISQYTSSDTDSNRREDMTSYDCIPDSSHALESYVTVYFSNER